MTAVFVGAALCAVVLLLSGFGLWRTLRRRPMHRSLWWVGWGCLLCGVVLMMAAPPAGTPLIAVIAGTAMIVAAAGVWKDRQDRRRLERDLARLREWGWEAAGPTGSAGTRGSRWSAGTVVPSAANNAGDEYLDKATGDVYRGQGGTSWTLVGNVKDPTGPTGLADGADGAIERDMERFREWGREAADNEEWPR